MMFSLLKKPRTVLGLALGAVLLLVVSFLRFGDAPPALLLILLGLAGLVWLATGPYSAWLAPRVAGRELTWDAGGPILWRFPFPSLSRTVARWKLYGVILAYIGLILVALSSLALLFPRGVGLSFLLAFFSLLSSSTSLGCAYVLSHVRRAD